MGSMGLQRWAWLGLAAYTLSHGVAGAAPGQEFPKTHHTLELLRPLAASTTDVEVTTAEGLKVGAWLLVQPGGDGPWQLTRIEGIEGNRLELNRAMDSLVLSSRPQVSVLRLQEQPTLHVAWQESEPRADAQRLLAITGQASPGDWAVVFVDGGEAARVQADSSGRISETVPVHLGSSNSQVQWVTRAGPGWEVSTLAPPAEPVVLAPLNNSYTNNTTPLFRGTAEPGVTVTLTISGVQVGTTTVDAAGNWSVSVDRVLRDNAYSTSVRARSSSGELSTAKVVTFVVDTEPPVTEIVTPPAPFQGSANHDVQFRVSDFGFTECSYDGGSFERCTSPYALRNMTEGPHTLTVRSTDRANTVEASPPMMEWLVDITRPGIRITSGPPRWLNDTGATFTFDSTETPVSFECKLDTADPFPCESNLKIGFLAGPHTFQVRARDRAYLYSDWASYEWTADLTPPAPAVLQQPLNGVLLGTGTPTFSGTSEPLGSVLIVANAKEIGTAPVDADGRWTFTPTTGLTTASYEVRVIARDQAGNSSEPTSPISLRVDVDPPDTSISSGPDRRSLESAPRFAFSATEPGVTYECSIGEEPFGSCVALTQGTRSFEPGSYTLRVRARDEVGNTDPTPAVREWLYNPYRTSGSGVLGCSSTAGAGPLLPLALLMTLSWRRRSRTRGAHTGGLLVGLTMAFLAAPSWAQGIELQQYKPGPGARDVLGAYSPRVSHHLGLSVGLSASYARDPLVLKDANGGSALSIVSSQFTTDVLASLALFEHFELGVALPLTLQQGAEAGSLAALRPEDATGGTVGDLRLVPKAVFRVAQGVDIGLALPLSLPTAGGRGLLGTSGVSVQPTLMAQWAPLEQFQLLANVGGRFQPENSVEVLDLSVGNALTYALAARWSPSGSPLSLQASLQGAMGLTRTDSVYRPLELLASAGYALPGGLNINVGGGPGLSSGYGTPSFRLLASIGWSTPPPTPAPTEK